MSYVYGIDPATLSTEYEIGEVIALARAANRFLSKHGPQNNMYLKPRAPVNPASGQGPDLQGFKRAFGSHYKTSLE